MRRPSQGHQLDRNIRFCRAELNGLKALGPGADARLKRVDLLLKLGIEIRQLLFECLDGLPGAGHIAGLLGSPADTAHGGAGFAEVSELSVRRPKNAPSSVLPMAMTLESFACLA